ncbi:hypothetical protein F4820DRAFT_443495 [Hypoxylon rubiginosum]|uniref:Uncharacterized protein n=1 Tax=Hypoxylon rubiginosum TaxID=110542 RepID=A0ACB9ZFK3_9PEZI|nr:hypothetical protein F4820DRAFT_443495 [Hypoxylon rubiginosum]
MGLKNNRKTRARLHRQLARLYPSLRINIILRVLEIERSTILGFRADAQLAMVLAACTGLEKLELPDTVTENYGPLSRKVIRWAARSSPKDGEVRMLGKLKHLELADMCGGIDVSDVIDMLSLPNIKDLRLWGLVDQSTRNPRRLPSPEDMPMVTNQNLVDLTLRHCRHLTDEGLTRILAACPRIRTLFLHAPMSSRNEHQPISFTSALTKYGKNLEFLWLETQRKTGLAKVPGESRRLLRALNSMRDLRTLVLWRGDFGSAEALGSALPSSLRELLIIGHNDEIETDEDGEVVGSSQDRISLFGLVDHPSLVNLERVEVVDINAWEGRPYWRKAIEYCIEARQLPPSC